MHELYDVAIIGGGPAGSTAAALLGRAGRRVIVLERESFPRFHIGESLLPYSMPTFERLGLRETMDRTFLHKHGAELVTSCGSREVRFHFKNGFRLAHTESYQVERATFDQLLLDHARTCGAEVHESTTVEKITFDSDGATLTINGESEAEVRARYVIDASGRNTVVGTHFKLKERYPTLNKFSVFAHWEGVTREPGIDGSLTRMVRGRDRWFWMIPLGETRMSIGLVMDTADFKALRQTPAEALEHAIAAEPTIMARMGAAERVTPVHSTGDYSYRNSAFAGERWLLAGDAAGFIDPVFSTGVFLAVASGEKAADAIDEALTHPEKRARRFRDYEKALGRVMNLYLRFVQSWYSHHFIEVITSPTTRFDLPGAINAVLAGNIAGSFAIWWRMQVFYLVVFLQRFAPLCPRLTLAGMPPRAPASSPAVAETCVS
ncbi:MAG: NAD(P)/FAD-dependent oxidoreductase [Chthoniobacteraceae bacterium]